jgi:osmotically-inducible protein OsmY
MRVKEMSARLKHRTIHIFSITICLALLAALGVRLHDSAIADTQEKHQHVQGGGEWDPYSTEREGVPSITAAEEASRIRSVLHDRVHNRWYNVQIVSQSDKLALNGEVDSEDTRRELLKAAQSVSQRQVQDELKLRAPIADREIKDSIARTLEQEYPKLAKELQVEVKDGRAALHGNVSSHRQIDAVLASVLMQEGVKDIESDVTVRGRPYPRNVTRR